MSKAIQCNIISKKMEDLSRVVLPDVTPVEAQYILRARFPNIKMLLKKYKGMTLFSYFGKDDPSSSLNPFI